MADPAVMIVSARHKVLDRLKAAGIAGATLPKPFHLHELLTLAQKLTASR